MRPWQIMEYLNYGRMDFRKAKKSKKFVENCTKYNESPGIYYMITKGKKGMKILKQISEKIEKRRNHRELTAEEKSFEEIYQALLRLRTCLKPGIVEGEAMEFLLKIKNMIRKRRRYYHMDVIAGYERKCDIDYIITDMIDRIDISQVFLKIVEPKEKITVTEDECAALTTLICRMGRERAVYMWNARRLRQLAEIMDMLIQL